MKTKAENVAVEQNEVQYRRAKTWQIAMFTLVNGANMAFYVLMTYVSYLANAGYGIAVAVTGVIMTATRLFDGVTDPIIALVVDRFNTRFGKIRILMWIGWAIESVACLTMFVFGSNGQHGIVFFVIAYLLYIIGYTVFGVSTNIVGPVMTNDPKQRPMLSRWSTMYSYLFPMIINIVVTMVLLPRYGNEYNVPMLSATCIFTIVFAAVMVALACIGVKDIDKPENFVSVNVEKKEEKKVSFKDMGALIKGNKAFQMYIVAAASDKLALTTSGQAVVATMFYGIIIGNMQLGTIFSVATMLPSILFLFISTSMAAKKGNKESMVTWTWACMAIAVIAVVFCALTDMTKIMRAIVPTVIFFIIMLLFGGFKMGVSACTGAMMHDIVDYEFSRTSTFMPGTVAATYSFVDKLISALASTVATCCVALIGFRDVMPQPTDTATTPIFWMTMFLMFGLPLIGWICTVVSMKFYPLSKDKMVEVQKKNQEIRKAAETVIEE